MNKFLQVNQLGLDFTDNGQNHTVFNNLSFDLDEGDFLCIIGPSGCGKTTLLRTVGGFIPASRGNISINGEIVSKPGQHCAMIFQTFDQLFPWRTVLGNVTYPLMVQKKYESRKLAEAQAEDYLHRVGLSDFLHYYPHQLSGGMKQRVAIARALAQEPSLILMDEPFASLDANTRTMLQRELKQLWNRSGLTVLFVTHSIMEAIALSTKVLALGTGEPSLRMFERNPVEGAREEMKTPESPGYSEYWSKLNRIVRG